MPKFLGLPCFEFKTDVLSMLVAESVGPRILSLRFHRGENLFAEVPDVLLDGPEGTKCCLWGGHRLWVAPEVPAVTYWPDDRPVRIESTPRGFRVSAPAQRTGLSKTLDVAFLPESTSSDATIFVEHILKNEGTEPVTCAPWAITQFKPGGQAVLWHFRMRQDVAGLQSDRTIRLWPYTDIRSPFIKWGNEVTLVHARMKKGALKVGFAMSTQTYLRDGLAFTKACHPVSTVAASACECYCNPRFLELETAGQVAALSPGSSVVHREVWNLKSGVTLDDLLPQESEP